MRPARPGRLLRAGFGPAGLSLRARSRPPVRPQGAPLCPEARKVKSIKVRNAKARLACGASLKPVLHRMSKRLEPIAVKAKPFGRCAALTE